MQTRTDSTQGPRRPAPFKAVIWVAAFLLTLSVLALGAVDPYVHPIRATVTDLMCIGGVLLAVVLVAWSAESGRR